MRKIEKKGIGVLLLAVVNVACDSSPQESESVIAGDPSTEITAPSEETQPVNNNAETTVTGFDSPITSRPDNTYDSVSADSNATPSPAEPLSDSETPSAPEPPPESETLSVTEPPRESENPQVNETPSVTETPSPTETNADAIVGNAADNLTDTISVSSTSYESVSTNGGTSASASAADTVSLDLSNAPSNASHSSTTVFGNSNDNYCAEVGDIFDINISGTQINSGPELSAVSLNAYSTLDLQNHPNVQLISQSDASIAVAVTTSDIIDLAVRHEHQIDLIYLSAATPEATKPFILKKEYQNGSCSFALYTDSGCSVVSSELSMGTATVGETSITAQGCTLGNPEQLPVIDLQE